MAEAWDQSRTEAPTPRRREEAREQGQVAFSAELRTGLVLLAGVAALALGGPGMATGLLTAVHLDLGCAGVGELGPEHVHTILHGLMRRGLEITGIVLGLVFVAGLASGVLQAGFHLSPGLLALNWEKLSPLRGWSRLFSLASGMRGVTALLKLAAIAVVVCLVMRGKTLQLAHMGESGLASTTGQAWGIILRLGWAIAGCLLAIGVSDYVFQRWRHEQSLRMTREELKEEVKREEGDPHVKARIRKLQREASKSRMFKEVPSATLVVTNPTHLAVALRYEKGSMAAPKVVAKGAGAIAQRIVDIARRHAVPVVERKSLARALYKTVNLDQEIPVALYYLVAEVVAYVYRLRGHHTSAA